MFGITIARCTMASASQYVTDLAERHETGLVVTPNIDHIIRLKDDASFFEIYQRASLITVDGMPLVWLSKLLPGASFPERVTGADLLVSVCKRAAEQHLSVAFVGGMPGIAELAGVRMQSEFPGLQVAFSHFPPFGFECNKEQSEEIVSLCRKHRPDILFFGVGAPKQEKWCDKRLNQLNTGPILCIGEALAFAAGSVVRAPGWMQRAGLEWLFRLSRDPGRLWKRYLLRDPRFVYLALREMISAWRRAG